MNKVGKDINHVSEQGRKKNRNGKTEALKPASESGDTECHDLFDSAEQVWFWFIVAQQARDEGARFVKGIGTHNRPCEPVDVLNILHRLYRKRILLRDHILVLRHYGCRLLPPDPYRKKEMRAHTIWREAMDRLEEVFVNKGIIFPSYLKSAMEAAE